jgi:hypothetical protein
MWAVVRDMALVFALIVAVLTWVFPREAFFFYLDITQFLYGEIDYD